jgi:predicted cupin superfamily sugar epimerase
LMTSIFYMLTSNRPIGHFHKNKSDIMHYFHLGSPMIYLTISPKGELEKFTLGPDIMQGHLLQLMVKGGYWKASALEKGDFGLLSEAVSPGFDYDDMTIAEPDVLRNQFPHLWDQVAPYVAK